MVRPGSFRVLMLALLLRGTLPRVIASVAAILVLMASASTATAGSQGLARVALHVKAHTTKGTSVCTTWSPNSEGLPCSRYVTAGDLRTAYDVYLTVVRGNPASGIAGLSCGIEYDDARGTGVDVYGWTLCGDLEFTNAGSRGDWPHAGAGTRIAWVRDTNCQRTVIGSDNAHAVAGAFYVYAYSTDALTVTPNNNLDSAPELAVADCQAATSFLSLSSGGKAAFSAGALAPGLNPCAPPAGGCELGPRSVRFDSLMVGAFQDSTIRVVNFGAATVTGSLSVSGSPFSLRSPAGSFQLAPMETLAVTVRFAPASVGSFARALKLGVPCGDIPLYGIGLSTCEFEPRPLEFGSVALGDTADRVVALRNGGSRPIAGAITLNGASFRVLQGGGAFALDPGDSLLVGVRFQPTALGAATGTVGAGASCLALALRGTGVPACITGPTRYDFGRVDIGGSADAAFSIRNGSARTLSGTIASTDVAFVIVEGGGPVEIPPGVEHPIVVRFQPDRGGSLSATIQTPVECQAIQVLGSAPLPPKRCKILPNSYIRFGVLQVGSVKDTVLTFVNSGQAVNTIRLIESQFREPFSLPDGGGTFVLAPGDSLRARVRCAPTVFGRVEIWIDTGQPCEDVTLDCIAQLQPVACTVQPEAMDYGPVRLGNYRDMSFMLTNSTGSPVTGPIEQECGDFRLLVEGGYWIESQRWAGRVVRFQPTSLGPQTCVIRVGGECADSVVAMGVGMSADSSGAPAELYPMSGPADPSQHIAYEVTVAAPVNLTVFDVVGRAVAKFDEGPRERGRFDVVWNSTGQPGGIYFVRLRAGAYEITRRILLLH